ncbi:MAG TPA: hypothetical protein PK684_09475 [Bacillota bacterium]|mgnify:FL=1|nr:hypothetical protein [Bacillota bacterium]
MLSRVDMAYRHKINKKDSVIDLTYKAIGSITSEIAEETSKAGSREQLEEKSVELLGKAAELLEEVLLFIDANKQ